MRWLHKIRLYPTCGQEREPNTMLHVTRDLYNALLQQRRDAWTMRRRNLTSKDQYKHITELRRDEPRFAGKRGLNRALLDAGLGTSQTCSQ